MGHFRVRAITPNRASAIMEWRQAMVGSSVHRFPLSVLREGVGVRALIVPTSSAPGNLMVLFGFYCSRKLDDRADDARVAVNRQTMLRSPIVRLVDFCARFPWPVIVCVLGLTALSGDYAARHFAIKTDINNLFPPTLPWTQRAASYMKAFPQRDILVVVDAPSQEFADAAAAKLTAVLAGDHEHFSTVEEAQGGPFFAQNGLLFMPTEEVARVTIGVQRA